MAQELVRALWKRIAARDWDGAAELLHPDAVIDWPHTGERIRGRERYVAIQRAYPDLWRFRILSVSAGSERVAAEVLLGGGSDLFVCAGFYEVEHGVIVSGTEYWTAALSEDPPPWRRGWTERHEWCPQI